MLRNIHQTVDDLKGIYVKTPRDTAFARHFDRLLRRDANGNSIPQALTFAAGGETRGIVLIDGAGGGKTSLVHHALAHHIAFANCDGNTMPVVSARIPSPATLKSLGLEILRQTGYPETSKHRERWQIWTLVRDRLKMLRTVVLWIDEARDLFQNQRGTEVRDILNTLKSLMQGQGAVIVILTGIEALWKIASYDDQVKRRYSKIALPPLSMAKDGKAIARQITVFCDRAGISAPADTDLVPRLIHASRERFGRCIENIIGAIELALYDNATSLDIQHFAETWGMQEGCSTGENVFLAHRWQAIDLTARLAA